MPRWAKVAIDEWDKAAGITSGPVFRQMRRGDHVQADAMSSQAIFTMVCDYAKQIGVVAKPHDLRRSFAKLAHKSNAAIEQIQLSLGHTSIQTTEKYLGVQQDLTSAPCDVLGLHL